MLVGYLDTEHSNGITRFALMQGDCGFYVVSRPLYGKLDDKVFGTVKELKAYYCSKLEVGATLTIH